MELLEGEHLGQIAEREKREGVQSPQSAATMLDYIIQASRGLAFAHQHGVIHRDVRPGNIFVTTRGVVKLTHFALARLPQALSPISAGVQSGSIDYMSPEQMRGDRVDAGTDIWAMGCTLYEVLTHTKPFHAESAKDWMLAILTQEPKPLRELRPDLPAELDKVLRRALKKERTSRYQRMDDLVADLEHVALKLQLPGSAGP